jgi:hypothetical protein
LGHLAQLVVGEGFDPLDSERIVAKIRSLSSDPGIIDELMEWIKTQNENGNLRPVLEFVFQTPLHERYHENFLITGLVPDHVRVTIESLRLKGVLSESVCDEIYKQALSDDSMIWTTDQIEEVIVKVCRKTSLKTDLSLSKNSDLKNNASFHS